MISENEIIELIKKKEEGPTLDYKEDLPLAKDGDKAEFVKDVIALANSGQVAHILLGVEDKTGRLVGFKTQHTPEQLNQILKDKCDPPISVEYVEKDVLGYAIAVIEIRGDNPPYIVSVPDKFGGPLSANPDKSFFIQRGTVFVRNYNMNEGARRADLDKIYEKIKYVALQVDLELTHEVTSRPSDNLIEADIRFFLQNRGDILSTNVYLWIQFANIRELVNCTGKWCDITDLNNGVPTIQLLYEYPVITPIKMHCQGVVVKIDNDVRVIEARVVMGAMNMRTKDGPYVIVL